VETCQASSDDADTYLYLSFHRPNRDHGFQLRILQKDGVVRTVDVVGNPLENAITPRLQPYSDSVSDDRGDDVLTFLDATSAEGDGDPNILFTDEKKKQVYVDLLYNKKQFVFDSAYVCYNNDAYTRKDFCEGETGYYGETKPRGTWDKPCFKDEECPFFKANTNYPNSRGGCEKGYCEMPINVQQISYRRYDPSIPAFCYNCNPLDGQYTCCTSQGKGSSGRSDYQLMTSPDYAFPNDLTDRFRSKSDLEEKDLRVGY
jgi:hypothetical protein